MICVQHIKKRYRKENLLLGAMTQVLIEKSGISVETNKGTRAFQGKNSILDRGTKEYVTLSLQAT